VIIKILNSITNTTEEEEQQQEEDGRELTSWRWEWEVIGVKWVKVERYPTPPLLLRTVPLKKEQKVTMFYKDMAPKHMAKSKCLTSEECVCFDK
jgi:hypothetical protein